MTSLSRRGFLKLTGTALMGAATPRFWNDDEPDTLALGRVLAPSVRVYDSPALNSRHTATYYFDNLIPLYGRALGNKQPAHNSVWYLTREGYVYSSWIQWVAPRVNALVRDVPEGGFLGEVTAAYVDARRQPSTGSSILYRLYHTSVYLVRETLTDDGGRPWYKLYDDRLGIHYHVPAEAIRRVPDDELTPISPQVAAKRIEVDLGKQRLVAYENDRPVLTTRIASGRLITSAGAEVRKYLTPSGAFRVERKKPSRHMGNGELSAESDYELPGVPWVSYFHWSGVAFHGTYWHNDFGAPQSEGCINMRSHEARWLYRWSHPVIRPDETFASGRGTEVAILR